MRSGLCCLVVLVAVALPSLSFAQGADLFVGAVVGIATLSGDPSSHVTSEGFALSNYKPENGPGLNAFVGIHLSEYVSLQGNYIWNRNDLTLFAAKATNDGIRFYEQPRASSQHQVVGDLLVYFRERASRIRPYLSAGLGIVHFETVGRDTCIDGGLPAPPADHTSTDVTLRVAVGPGAFPISRSSV